MEPAYVRGEKTMTYRSIIISSGHGKYIRGASGILDEVDEARLVVEKLAGMLRERDVDVKTYHDDVSTTQSENLQRIVDFHNQHIRQLDISVHFNAYVETDKPMGTEVLYVTQSGLANDLSAAISRCGLINRGGKKRTDLFFLNETDGPAVLLEICFVDSEADAEIYEDQFDEICEAIADILVEDDENERPEPPAPDAAFHAIGKCSYFGGPDDITGMTDEEGLAFIYEVQDAPHLFLPEGTPGTENMGLARKLNPYVPYVACRWDYDETSKEFLLEHMALVKSTRTGTAIKAFPADWGPNEKTGRVADLSPGLMDYLGIETDDEVEVIFPYD
jgi:N-acetylmuramoyl-L-alanine amidase